MANNKNKRKRRNCQGPHQWKTQGSIKVCSKCGVAR